jgi:hypothetical protein
MRRVVNNDDVVCSLTARNASPQNPAAALRDDPQRFANMQQYWWIARDLGRNATMISSTRGATQTATRCVPDRSSGNLNQLLGLRVTEPKTTSTRRDDRRHAHPSDYMGS